MTHRLSAPRVHVGAGPNASAKATTTERAEYVNPDQIAQEDLGDWKLPQR